ncbi:acetyltransferase domain-containing protein [Xylaria sp. FL1042]|nr:acetyltransferase domain-containing protein [Xylaria sp. FL1042]
MYQKMASQPSPKIKVQTTLPTRPFPSNAERAPIRTERLIIRPLTRDDLASLHALRTQPAVMACTALGRVDADLAETQTKLDPFLPPRDTATYNPGIYLAETDELIGLGGVFGTESEIGWPEVGYMLREECWGKGYATEFLRAFVRAWWSLDREGVEVEVDALSVSSGGEGKGEGKVPEMLCAIVEDTNNGSLRVMEKAGFRRFKSWTVKSRRAGSEGAEVTLVGFVRTEKDS